MEAAEGNLIMGHSLLDRDTSFANGRFNLSGVVLPEIGRMFRQVTTTRQLREGTIARVTNIRWKSDEIMGLPCRGV
jgi:hypothetical protein